ncbi:hypothetical protein B0H12DRAFT_1077546 [Mycena haematopus]|nr:hypothetical protein B0H12DRAFT_1077546 [Mycena haematopus]
MFTAGTSSTRIEILDARLRMEAWRRRGLDAANSDAIKAESTPTPRGCGPDKPGPRAGRVVGQKVLEVSENEAKFKECVLTLTSAHFVNVVDIQHVDAAKKEIFPYLDITW